MEETSRAPVYHRHGNTAIGAHHWRRRRFELGFGTLAIHWHPRKILRRSSQGNPSVGGLKRKSGIAKYSEFGPIEGYISEALQHTMRRVTFGVAAAHVGSISLNSAITAHYCLATNPFVQKTAWWQRYRLDFRGILMCPSVLPASLQCTLWWRPGNICLCMVELCPKMTATDASDLAVRLWDQVIIVQW